MMEIAYGHTVSEHDPYVGIMEEINDGIGKLGGNQALLAFPAREYPEDISRIMPRIDWAYSQTPTWMVSWCRLHPDCEG